MDLMPCGVQQHGEGSLGCPCTVAMANQGNQAAVPGQRGLPWYPQMGTDTLGRGGIV